jgi:glucosylceramidase
MGRIPMNSPDFAISSYNHDNVSDDFALRHFDAYVTRDRQAIIPFVADAIETVVAGGGQAADLRLYFSPWSPPGWMKTSGAAHDMIGSNDPCLKPGAQYAQAWALYFVRFADAYAKAGINFWGLTMQNEPLTSVSGGAGREWRVCRGP